MLISAAHKSSGKTTLSIGLCAALRRRGYKVQPFKKGPDYIDPLWLATASGRECYNLDFNTQTEDEISALWQLYYASADIGFIEGNKGLFDGVDPLGSDCNAALAKRLDTPIILVVDVQGMTRGIAPLVLGYCQFDRDINIIALILNKVAGKRHEKKLRAAIKQYTNFDVLGAVYRHEDLRIDERHLGLIPSNEHQFANGKVDTLRKHVEEQVDTDQLIKRLGLRRRRGASQSVDNSKATALRIGIAQDAAFGFYYQDDLQAFTDAGAKLLPIDLLNGRRLPDIDALFIGGGFPEVSMRALAANRSMLDDVKLAVDNGLPTYAECGGLMYLCRSIRWQGEEAAMAGALPADVVMHTRPQGRGYVKLRETKHHPWVKTPGRIIAAHEFHHSALILGEDVKFAYDVVRGSGIKDAKDGIVHRNTLASYAHLRDTQNKHWVAEFVRFITVVKEGQA